MIYGLPMIIILIFLAVFFREEIKDNTSEYLVMVCFGALVWPITVIYLGYVWFEWRRG